MIPVHDSPRARRTPWVNYSLILINAAVFLWMLTISNTFVGTRGQLNRLGAAQTEGVCYGYRAIPTDADAFVCKWAFQPKEFFDTVRGHSDVLHPERAVIVFTIISALFLHAGWVHIIGNMIFLWVFGDNVEDRLGHAGYLIFYLLAGIAATLTQGFIDPDSIVPVLGASGAIAGVLGAYLVFFPRARVTAFIVIPIPLFLPAFILIGLWFVQNLVSGLATITSAGSADTTVAFFAHIGGFVFGMVVALLIRMRRTATAPRRAA